MPSQPSRILKAKKQNPKGRIPKTSRKLHTASTRKALIALIGSGQSLNKSAKRLGLAPSSANAIIKRSHNTAAALKLDILDDGVYKPPPGRSQDHLKRFTPGEEDNICAAVVSCKEDRDLPVKNYIAKHDLKCSVSTLNGIMYARSYFRKNHTWTRRLNEDNNKKRVAARPDVVEES